MSTIKHEKNDGEDPFASDLEGDPGNGQSRDLFATGEDPICRRPTSSRKATRRTAPI